MALAKRSELTALADRRALKTAADWMAVFNCRRGGV